MADIQPILRIHDLRFLRILNNPDVSPKAESGGFWVICMPLNLKKFFEQFWINLAPG